jgi:hypothetical protein
MPEVSTTIPQPSIDSSVRAIDRFAQRNDQHVGGRVHHDRHQGPAQRPRSSPYPRSRGTRPVGQTIEQGNGVSRTIHGGHKYSTAGTLHCDRVSGAQHEPVAALQV